MHSLVSLTLNIPDGWCNRMAAHVLAPGSCHVLKSMELSSMSPSEEVVEALFLAAPALVSLRHVPNHNSHNFPVPCLIFSSLWSHLESLEVEYSEVYQLILRCFRSSRRFQVSTCIPREAARCQISAHR